MERRKERMKKRIDSRLRCQKKVGSLKMNLNNVKLFFSSFLRGSKRYFAGEEFSKKMPQFHHFHINEIIELQPLTTVSTAYWTNVIKTDKALEGSVFCPIHNLNRKSGDKNGLEIGRHWHWHVVLEIIKRLTQLSCFKKRKKKKAYQFFSSYLWHLLAFSSGNVPSFFYKYTNVLDVPKRSS